MEYGLQGWPEMEGKTGRAEAERKIKSQGIGGPMISQACYKQGRGACGLPAGCLDAIPGAGGSEMARCRGGCGVGAAARDQAVEGVALVATASFQMIVTFRLAAGKAVSRGGKGMSYGNEADP